MSTKMSRSLFSLVLLLACAHALMHLLEFALPATEQFITESYHVDKAASGRLGMTFRLPLGLFALATGQHEADVSVIGAFAAEAVAQAIRNAVHHAASLFDVKSRRDWLAP